MQMHFQEEILYAHALAQQERQRSNELMSQVCVASYHLMCVACKVSNPTRPDKLIRCEDTCAPDAARQRAFLGHRVYV